MKCRPTAPERLATPSSQEQRGRVHSARGKNDQARGNRSALPRDRNFDAGDALAVRTDKQSLDGRILSQFDISVSKSFAETTGFGVHLAGPRVGKSVPRRLRPREPLFEVDAERKGKGAQSDALQTLPDLGDRRLVGNRTIRVRRGMPGFGRVEAETAADVVESLGQGVPGFEFVVGKGPARRRAFAVRDRREVLSPVA
jgi:hypothetical protein